MLDQTDLGLVGRDETAALLELLVDRRWRQPLPIITAFGPGGSGKTTLLDHIQRRYSHAPIARVNLDDTGSRSCRDVLDALYLDLVSYANPRFGELHMPRYALVRTALRERYDEQSVEATEPRSYARRFLARRLSTPRKMNAVTAGMTPALPRFARMLRPLTMFLASLAVIAPAWLRWFLLGPQTGTTLRWFERHLGRDWSGMRGAKIDAVVAALWNADRSEELEDIRRLDRLATAAFVADLRAAYRRRRHRRFNAIVLLDGADLLSEEPIHLYPRGRDEPAAPASDLVRLFAQELLARPDTPLLVVATKQATPLVEEVPVPADLTTRDGGADPGPGHAVDRLPIRAARRRYDGWRQMYERARRSDGPPEDAYLPVRLRPFTLEQTRQFLSELNTQQRSTMESQVLVEELHEVTRGHPLAVRLAIEVVEQRYLRTRVVPSVRAMFAMPVPASERGAEPGETVSEYLMMRFLQRFRGDSDVREREQTLRLLGRLAAPRRLDESVVAELLKAVPENERPGPPGTVIDRLARLSFTELSADRRFMSLHPLLRDLLSRWLEQQSGADGASSYAEVHALLRDFYAERGSPYEVDYLYHALAGGDFALVARRLQNRADIGEEAWLDEVAVIAQAPMSVTSRTGTGPKLWERLERLKTTTEAIGRRFRSDLAERIEAVVMATWQLHSASSTVRRTPELFDKLIEAYRSLDAADGNADGNLRLEQRIRLYRRLARAAESGVPERGGTPLPEFCLRASVRGYPPVWPPRGTMRNFAVAVPVVLVLGYAGVYVWQAEEYCNVETPWDPARVVNRVLDDSTVLTQHDDGECIGVTDRAGVFSDADSAGLLPDEAEVNELVRLIDEQNEEVLRQADAPAGRPYVTVVVAGMLSSAAEEPNRDLSAGVNELRGVYLAQQEWNRLNSPLYKPSVLLRVAFANFGGNSEHAEETAMAIRRYAERDPTVVAVTGMGQTRDSTVRAAELLGCTDGNTEPVPMVGSAPSGNAFGGKPYFVRIAPSNDRQAEVLVQFAATDEELRGRTPFLVYDPADRYSDDLVNSLRQHLVREHGQQPPRLGRPVELAYEANSPRTAQSLRRRVAEICAESMEPLVVYAGRANEMPTLLEELGRSECGEGAVILGGDDVSQLETAGFADLAGREEYVDERLFFATFGPTRAGWEQIAADQGGRPSPLVGRFFDVYADASAAAGTGSATNPPNTGTVFNSPPNGHVLVAYDAAWLLMEAVTRVDENPDLDIHDRTDVFTAVRATTARVGHEGVSGRIDFGPVDEAVPHAGADPRDKLVTIQMVDLDGNRLMSRYRFSHGSG